MSFGPSLLTELTFLELAISLLFVLIFHFDISSFFFSHICCSSLVFTYLRLPSWECLLNLVVQTIAFHVGMLGFSFLRDSWIQLGANANSGRQQRWPKRYCVSVLALANLYWTSGFPPLTQPDCCRYLGSESIKAVIHSFSHWIKIQIFKISLF